MLSIYRPGAEVQIGQIVAKVITINISGNAEAPYVQYKCAWWAADDRKEQWIEEHELSGNEKDRIGFSWK